MPQKCPFDLYSEQVYNHLKLVGYSQLICVTAKWDVFYFVSPDSSKCVRYSSKVDGNSKPKYSWMYRIRPTVAHYPLEPMEATPDVGLCSVVLAVCAHLKYSWKHASHHRTLMFNTLP